MHALQFLFPSKRQRGEEERAVQLEDIGCRSAKRSLSISEVHTVFIPIPTHTVLSRYMYDTRRVKLLTYHRPPAIFPHSFSFHCPFLSCPSYP